MWRGSPRTANDYNYKSVEVTTLSDNGQSAFLSKRRLHSCSSRFELKMDSRRLVPLWISPPVARLQQRRDTAQPQLTVKLLLNCEKQCNCLDFSPIRDGFTFYFYLYFFSRDSMERYSEWKHVFDAFPDHWSLPQPAVVRKQGSDLWRENVQWQQQQGGFSFIFICVNPVNIYFN